MHRDLANLQRSAKDMARWQKAQQQLMGGRHASALASYEDLLKHFPGVAQLWFETGIAAAGELDFDFASQSFHKAAELDPRDFSLLILIGQQFHRLRRLDQARACFDRAVAIAPVSPVTRINLAMWLEREGQLEGRVGFARRHLMRLLQQLDGAIAVPCVARHDTLEHENTIVSGASAQTHLQQPLDRRNRARLLQAAPQGPFPNEKTASPSISLPANGYHRIPRQVTAIMVQTVSRTP